MVRFSELRERIIIMQNKSGLKNALGENVTRWLPVRLPTHGSAESFKGCIVSGEPFIQDMTDDEYKAAETEYGTWAKVTPVSEREFTQAKRERSETTYNIKIRYNPDVDITTDMKVLHRKKILDIESVINLYSKDTEVDLVCREVDVNGK